jgi:hypothetical protein
VLGEQSAYECPVVGVPFSAAYALQRAFRPRVGFDLLRLLAGPSDLYADQCGEQVADLGQDLDLG